MEKNQSGILKLYLLPICFTGILFFHFIDQLIDLTPNGENTENRNLVEKPVFRIDNLDPYPSDFEAYFNDHFKWRNYLIEAHNHFNYFFLKKSALPNEVVMGKNGWLFHADGTDLYRGKTQFTYAELESIRKELLFRKEFVEQKGGKYYLIVIPQKQSLYSEFLPDHILKINEKSRTENLIDHIRESSDLAVINLTDTLKSIKQLTTLPLFYKTDHHWNAYGAFLASQPILKRLKQDFPNLDTLDLEEYNFEFQNQPGRITARMLKLEDHLKDQHPIIHYTGNITLDTLPNNYPVPEGFPYKDEYVLTIKSSNTEAPSMLMVRESFAVQLIDVFSKYFSESTYVFDNWMHSLNPQIVENEQPDIYIQLVYEKLLDNLLKNQSSK